MKLKRNLIIRQVADSWIVMSLEDPLVDLNGILTLNSSAAFLWQELEKGADREGLIDAMTSEYDVARDQASDDIDEFLHKLQDAGCLDEI